MAKKNDDKNMVWKVNTPQLIKEVLTNHGMGCLHVPMNIFSSLLTEVAKRASELNDPKMNALMCRLAMYEISDPYSKEYDSKMVEEILNNG